MTIVVGGYIIGYPLGGMTWHHLNYLLGLHELGHEVWFLEDSGEYSVPYNPETKRVDPDSAFGRRYLERTFTAAGLPLRYCYYSQFEDHYYGLSSNELDALLKRADLLICVSGVTPVRPQRPRPRNTLVIDTDPVFTQLRMRGDEHFASYFRSFDHAATFGRLIGTPACPLPTHGINWIPTNQPVSLKHWPVCSTKPAAFTTVGKWEHAAGRAAEFQGRQILSSKSVEWMKLVDLPRQTSWRLHLAMESMPQDARQMFESRGWSLGDAESASRTCESFADFVRTSAGELTVVKQIYNAIPSGWFSDRSACYLASGRPVVMQTTGFASWLPTGQGVFAFEDTEDAAGSLARIHADYSAQSRAARCLAETYFDARKVLSELLDRVM